MEDDIIMSKNKLQKLELTWIGKGNEPKLEPRILIENPEYSYGDPNTENILIHGDNLLALKALEQDFAGKVKTIYIDPPYNTGNAFEHYDDGVEHSLWLSLIKPRLTILKNLLSEDGSIWISIDDDESHYLKVLCDEVFGRRNFINNIVWQKKYGPANDAKWLSDTHEHILVFAKNKEIWRPNLVVRNEKQLKDFKNPDNDSRGSWRASDLSVKTFNESCNYPITGPTGKVFMPPPTRAWVISKEKFEELKNDNRIWWGVKKDARPMVKKFITEVRTGITPETWWTREFAGDNKIGKYESKILYDGNSFSTPKPELLLHRIIHLSSKKGDLVLDSFLGSGTTSAVALKMRRKFIGIELGEHAKTHCYPRLKAVVDGEQGGITKEVDWQGGGGFKFYTLAPSLLKQDKFGNWVISPEYNPDMLAAAMAKQEGFTYLPNEEKFWKQGNSSENDYIFTTTQFMTVETLDIIHDDMKEGESILICCKAFQKECKSKYPNITLKKIPQMLLDRCEFGKDDYSLNIVNLPKEEANNEDDIIDEVDIESVQEIRDNKEVDNQGKLFE